MKNKVLVLGDGLLGSELVKQTGWEYVSRKKNKKDLYSLLPIILFHDANVIVNCIANTDTYSDDKESMMDVNHKFVVQLVDELNLVGKKKLIHISTDYVYPGTAGNYSEDDPLSPFKAESDGNTKYGWSKLGGECAVRMYDNSLILWLCMCDYPFPHDTALIDVKKSYLYNFQAAAIIMKLLNKTGVINVGGKAQSVYDFASQKNPEIKKCSRSNIKDVSIAPNTTMNIDKLRGILREDR